ncbi:MAG TPA: hypothetical protein VNA69_17130 [Thermoanaerobaculia bacterium]|nr:hypothetical protein [Thermoanaerobaculia bacterium]
MWKQVKTVIAPGMLPLAWAAILTAFIILYRLFDLPTPAEIVPVAKRYFDAYGWPVLIFAAFVECLFMISVYFPGSLVIAIAVLVSDKTLADLLRVGLFSWVGFVAALPVNYWLGEKGFYKVLLKIGRKDVVARMQDRLERRGRLTLFLSAIHPNFLAITMVCLGIARQGVLRSTFLGGLYLIPWVALIITVLGATTSRVDVTDKNQAWYFVAAFLIWAIVEILRARRWKTSAGT